MILRKTIPRNIREKKFQYSGVTLLLFFSVMLYVGLSMAISTLDKRNEQFSKENNQESFHLVTSDTLSKEQLSTWENEYHFKLEERHYQNLQVSEDTTLRLLGITNKINIPFISEGKMPDKSGEIAVAEAFAAKNGFQIGDEIDLNGTKGKITGFVYLPDYIYMIQHQYDIISNPKQFGIGITVQDTFSKTNRPLQTEVLGFKENGKIPNEFLTDVKKQSAILQYVENEENARIQYIDSEIEGASTTITSLSTFILILSIVMILMLMKRRLELQRKEIGTLLALGYRRNELQFHYLGYAWIVGLTGSVTGILAGAGLSVPLSNMYSNYFNLPAVSMFDWSPSALLIGFFMPIILLVLLTTVVIHRTLRLDPLTLLRPKEVTSGKKSWFEKLPWMQTGTFIRRFRLRLLVRNKARSFYIFLGVMFSTILLLFGFIAFRSMNQLVDTTYQDVQSYNYAVHYKSLQSDEVPESESPFVMSEIKIANDKGKKSKASLYGIIPETDYLHLMNGEERLNQSLNDGVVISRPLAAVLGVNKGDSLTLTNTLNQKEWDTQVQGVTDIYIGKTLYLPLKKVNAFLGYPKGSYTAVWQKNKPEVTNNVFMIEDKQKVIDSFEASSGATRYSVFGMAGFAIMIGVIVLTLLTNLIVEENSPSISLFKVMGYTNQEVSKLVLNVYTPVVFLSYFISIPLAVLGLKATFNSLVEQTGFLLPTTLTGGWSF
ncbi:ABC transporter permease [Halobacillus salinarum]|uniref:ABC transporter permease n=1 Tax=Halobacillus salinarum TaxID=2932257 RepID=A0ABY4EEZ4_9BACI|nr:ABC transporter permease [Halobacillus salinarum]UOQ42628.1 ABC transporter permease [Halobacillus salinarum]